MIIKIYFYQILLKFQKKFLVNEYVKYISKLLNYYFTLYYATLKIRDTLNINRNVYINKDSVIINDKLKALSVTS